MNRRLVTLCAAAVVGSCFFAAPARAGVTISIFPPAAYVATSRPVYYQGHASYWYQGHWHYRNGRTWRTYNTEPRYLHDYRGHHEPERHYYGYRH
jgi:hypothetical protein